MTKILKRLEEAGYVSRSPDPDDGRGMRVTLTDRGRSLQERVFHAFLAATTSMMAPLTSHQVEAANRSLSELLDLFGGTAPATRAQRPATTPDRPPSPCETPAPQRVRSEVTS